MNLAGSEQPLLHFERKMPWNQGLGTLEPDIVSIGAIASSNLVYVPGAFCDDERGTCAFTFQHGIDRNRGSMHKGIDRIHADARLLDAVVNSLFQTRGRGRTFGTEQPPG